MKSTIKQAHHKIKKVTEHPHFKRYAFLLLLIIPIFLSIWLRSIPATLPVTDQWAESTVNNFYRNQISNSINQQFPNLPDANRELLIQKELTKAYEQQGDQLNTEIQTLSEQFKEQLQDETGQTYLIAIDPYLWYGEARNYLENGHPGTELRDGKPVHGLRNGREGQQVSFRMHPWIIAKMHKVASIFDKDATLMKTQFYHPVIFMTLAAIFAFLLARLVTGTSIGGLVASILVVIHPSILTRTTGGFADTDAYHAFYPLLMAYLFILGWKLKDKRQSLLAFGGAGLASALYGITWPGWWNVFGYLVAASIAYFIYRGVLSWYRKESGKAMYLRIQGVVVAILSASIFLTLFRILLEKRSIVDAISILSRDLLGPLKFAQYKQVATVSVWPNVLTTVAELNLGNINNILQVIGGTALFFVVLLAMLLPIYHNKTPKKQDAYYILASVLYFMIILAMRNSIVGLPFLALLTVPVVAGAIFFIWKKEEGEFFIAFLFTGWLVSTMFATLQGIRFAAFLVLPYAIGMGLFAGWLYKSLPRWFSKVASIDAIFFQALTILLIVLFFIPQIATAKAVAISEVPSMNDGWNGALQKIHDDANDGIITSWWDFGHWFVAMGERRVTFDGGDHGKRIHWVGKALLESDEAKSVGILKMLNCGQEQAVDLLEEFTGDTVETIRILDKSLTQSREEALAIYKTEGMDDASAQALIELTHCTDLIPQYLITSEDMTGKATVWGHFGSWNFTKAKMYMTTKKLNQQKGVTNLVDNFGLSQVEAQKIYTQIKTTDADKWVSPWPSFMSGVRGCTGVKNKELICTQVAQNQQFEIHVPLDTMDAYITGTGDAQLRPATFSYMDGDELITKTYEDNVGFSIILIPGSTGVATIITDPLLANSMYTRMFFMNGAGLEYYRPFDSRQLVTGAKVATWKVSWDAQEPIPPASDILPEIRAELEELEQPVEEIEAENLSTNETANTTA